MKYSVTVGYNVSQTIDVEADDWESAVDLACDLTDYPNISNKFEESGDVVCYGVYDNEGRLVYKGDN